MFIRFCPAKMQNYFENYCTKSKKITFFSKNARKLAIVAKKTIILNKIS